MIDKPDEPLLNRCYPFFPTSLTRKERHSHVSFRALTVAHDDYIVLDALRTVVSNE